MIDTICLLIPKDRMRYLSDIANWEMYSKGFLEKKILSLLLFIEL